MKKIIFIILGTTVADILTKWWAHIWSPDVALLGDVIRFTYIRNTGIAFSTQLPYIHIIIPLVL
jgi:lipoprotein signal peptidase